MQMHVRVRMHTHGPARALGDSEVVDREQRLGVVVAQLLAARAQRPFVVLQRQAHVAVGLEQVGELVDRRERARVALAELVGDRAHLDLLVQEAEVRHELRPLALLARQPAEGLPSGGEQRLA